MSISPSALDSKQLPWQETLLEPNWGLLPPTSGSPLTPPSKLCALPASPPKHPMNKPFKLQVEIGSSAQAVDENAFHILT